LKEKLKSIGIVAVTAIVMGNMIGAGIFTIPNAIGQYGWYGIIAFALTAAGALLLGLVFANLARRMPKTGGPYAYTRAVFGDFPGFWIGWGYWIGLWTGQVAIAVTFASYLGIFIPPLRESLVYSGAAALAALVFVTAVNVRGVRTAGAFAVVTTVIRALPLLAIATVGWWWFHPGNYATALPSGNTAFMAITAAATITLFSFLGLESGTVPAGDVREPRKTIPRATMIGIVAVAFLYIASTVVVMGVVRADALASGTTAFADAGREMWGRVGYYAVAFAGVVSTLGALSGFTLLNGQVPYAAAVDHLFPKQFARVNRHGAPAWGMVVSSALVGICMIVGYALLITAGKNSAASLSTASIIVSTLSTVLPYAFCAMAEVILIVTTKDPAGRSVGLLLIVPAIAFVYSLLIIWGAGPQSIVAGFFLLLIGLPVYAFIRWSETKDDPKTPGLETEEANAA